MPNLTDSQKHLLIEALKQLANPSELEKDILSKWAEKQTGAPILISNKVDCKTKLIKRNREDHYILNKGKFHQDDIANLRICVTNAQTPKFIKETTTD